MKHHDLRIMNHNHLPSARTSATQSGEMVAVFDCLECEHGVYVPGPAPQCLACGAAAPAALAQTMAALQKKVRAA